MSHMHEFELCRFGVHLKKLFNSAVGGFALLCLAPFPLPSGKTALRKVHFSFREKLVTRPQVNWWLAVHLYLTLNQFNTLFWKKKEP